MASEAGSSSARVLLRGEQDLLVGRITSSRAAMDFSRPTNSGTIMYGKHDDVAQREYRKASRPALVFAVLLSLMVSSLSRVRSSTRLRQVRSLAKMPSLLAVRIVARWQQKARIATILKEDEGGASVLLAAGPLSVSGRPEFHRQSNGSAAVLDQDGRFVRCAQLCTARARGLLIMPKAHGSSVHTLQGLHWGTRHAEQKAGGTAACKSSGSVLDA